MSGVSLCTIRYSKITKQRGINMLVNTNAEKTIASLKSIIRKMPKRYKDTALQVLNQTIHFAGVNTVARNVELSELDAYYLLWEIVYAEDFYGVNNYIINCFIRFVSIIQGQPLTIPECYEISKQIKS